MQYPKFIKAGIVLTVLAAAVVAGCSRSQASGAPAAPPAPAVSVAEVVAKPLRDFEEFTGRLEPVTTVQIQARVSGFIESAQFAEGAQVKKGQVLFRIDPRPYQAEVDRLAAQLKRAHSQAALAEQNHERGKQLIAKHVIAQQDFDQLATTATSSGDDIGAAAAALEAARLNLEFTQVRSPIDGRASRMLITPGNLVTTTSVLTTVVSDNPVYTYFDVDEATYLRFAHGATKAECDAVGGNLMKQTQYLLHVWVVPGYESPEGVYAHLSSAITCDDGTYDTIKDVTKVGTKTSICADGTE